MNRTGTREWSKRSLNIDLGCKNNCRYCYAREMAVRFGRCTWEEWGTPVTNGSMAQKRFRRREGVTMFPTTHDITMLNLGDCMMTLEHLLDAGNQVLVVTKPHTLTMSALMPVARRHGDRIELRCTITAGGTTEEVERTAYWEPGAPPTYERLWALKMACDSGVKTSMKITAQVLQQLKRTFSS